MPSRALEVGRKPSRRKGLGQAVVLLLAVLVAMAALALWIPSIHSAILERLRSQDAGDAAALAVARWQAAGLNLCGELNLIQAYMLADDVSNAPAAQALHELRQRIQLTAPVLGLLAAQRVASANKAEPIPEATDYLKALRQTLMPVGQYEGAEQDLRDILGVVVEEPIYALPLTPAIDTSAFPTLLAEQDFYEAILARDWCWFWFNAYAFLQHYKGRADFGRVPELSTEPFFGLRLGEVALPLDALDTDLLSQQLQERGHPALPPPPDPRISSPAHEERPMERLPGTSGEEGLIQWTTFNSAKWGAWEAMHANELPLAGTLREEYDYEGASAVVGVRRGSTTWMAAAKAFGSVGEENPVQFELVLGGFNDVRLIPVDAADAGVRGIDFAWLRHVRLHVRDYALSGFMASGCRYCEALRKWENPAFRAEALAWLEVKGHTCKRPRGGSGESGGARYGH